MEEKASIVRRLLAEVELGVEEATMMSQLASHLSGLEGERAKLRAQVCLFICLFICLCFVYRFVD